MTERGGDRRLGVWLGSTRVATLAGNGGKGVELAYSNDVVTGAIGRIVLSVSMPVRAEPYPDEIARVWADNLLPEGPTRAVIAGALGVRTFDTFGLLAEVGRDCAGAVSFLSEGQSPADQHGTYRVLDDDELRILLTTLRVHPLGMDLPSGATRLSLAGVQDKALLAKVDGRWAQPVDGAPSSYLVKPEPPGYRGMAAAEHFCLRWARTAGLDASVSELLDVDHRRAVAIRRYDRAERPDGRIVRRHQEDTCQALGCPSDRKYESLGGPTLRDVAALLRSAARAPVAEMNKLLDAMVLTAAAGNADGHGKNLSILIDDGAISLAPLYDVVPTIAWEGLETEAGMSVNGKPDVREWRADDLVTEATAWGMPVQPARRRIENLLARLEARLPETADACGLPDGIRRVMTQQLAGVRR